MANLSAEQIFHAAREMPTEKRAGYLEGACGTDVGLRSKVEGLLAADVEAGSFMAVVDEPGEIAASEKAGERIGRYKLLQSIGEGGFGTVWLAEQREPVRRRVALKIIKLGMDTKQVIARFEVERQALAMMDHPNVAKVLDAGSTKTGRPYFVMELVKGVPLLEYCDTEKLDTRARLELFAKVCDAIQHAHQKGILHRDVKPTNVMVTLHDGVPVPKVIDFGLAKATNQELTQKTLFTEHRQMLGTPAYMSPEQMEMSGLDVDTRTDVYSLGVLLYELLTGTTPFSTKDLLRQGFVEMIRVIREETPERPSTRLSTLGETASRTAVQRRADPQKLGALLRGDLDWIVMRCLAKDRRRRYDTANGLAADVRRHLADEPVTACPPSAGYRLRKFVRRNRVQVIAGAAVAAVLILGVIGTSWGMVRAIDEKSRADSEAKRATTLATAEAVAKKEAVVSARTAMEEAERARVAEQAAMDRAKELGQVAAFQAEQLRGMDVQLMGVRLRKALVAAAPEEEREALAEEILGIDFTGLAAGILEENLFQRTIAAIDKQFAAQPKLRAFMLNRVGSTMYDLGLYDLADDPQARALALCREHHGRDHELTLVSIQNVGMNRLEQGKLEDAESLAREGLQLARRSLGNDHPVIARLLRLLGWSLQRQGRYDDAEPYTREALEINRRVLGKNAPDTLDALNNLGLLLKRKGKLKEAETVLRDALERRRRILGSEAQGTISTASNLGAVLKDLGRLAEAKPYFQEVLDTNRRRLGDEHPDTLNAFHNMGSVLNDENKPKEAEPYFREAIKRRRVLGKDHPYTLQTISSLSACLWRLNRLEEAEPLMIEALQGLRRVHGNDHPNTLNAIDNLAALRMKQGRFPEADRLFQEAVAGRRRVLGPHHPSTLFSIGNLGSLRVAEGKFKEAEVLIREVVVGSEESFGPNNPRTLQAMANLANTLQHVARWTELEALYRKVIQRSKGVADAASVAYRARRDLGYALVSQRRLAEAAPLLEEALIYSRQRFGDRSRDTLTAISHLAVLKREQGRMAEAEQLFREMLDSTQKAFRDEHPWTAYARGGLGHLLWTEDRLEEAEPYFEANLAYYRKRHGLEHPDTLRALNNFGSLRQKQGRATEAEQLFREATEIIQRTPQLGSQTRVFANLGKLLRKEGKLEEARSNYEAALEVAHAQRKKDNESTALFEHRLAEVLLDLEHLEEALPLARRSVDRYVKHPRWSPRETDDAFRVLLSGLPGASNVEARQAIFEAWNKDLRTRPSPSLRSQSQRLAKFGARVLGDEQTDALEAAEVALRQCLEIDTKIHPDDHPKVWRRYNTKSLLGGVLLARAAVVADAKAARALLEEAKPLLVESAEWMRDNPDRPPAKVATQAIERVAKLYETRHEREPGAGYDAHAKKWRDLVERQEAPPR